MNHKSRRRRERGVAAREHQSTESTFRRLISQLPACDDLDHEDHRLRLYSRFGIEDSSKQETKELLSELLETQIADALGRDVATDWERWVRALRRQLLVRNFVDEEPIWPHLGVLDALRAAARRRNFRLPALSNSESWRAAISAALDLHLLSFTDFDALMIRRRNVRQHGVAEGILTLRKAGYRVSVFDGKGKFAPGEEQRLAKQIDSYISDDPVNCAAAILHHLSKRYSTSQQRYHFPRRHVFSAGIREGSTPYSYLLNLCAKHARLTIKRPMCVEAAVNLATSFVAALDIEAYHIVEVINKPSSDLSTYLTELTTSDALFSIPQFRPDDVPLVLRGLFDWIGDADAQREFGWSIRDAATVAKHILRTRGVSPHLPRVFSAEEISQGIVGVRPGAVDRILQVYAHQIGRVNRDFVLPLDQQSLNFGQRPLVTLEDGRYLLVNRSWCAPAFYEAVRALAHETFAERTNREIGGAFERLVHHVLEQHGVVTCSGKYRHRGIEGDCDVVVETSEAIILLELKSKALTRIARSGHDVRLLLDVAKSMLDAQAQLAKHELLLIEQGYIDLLQRGEKYRLSHANRSVLRVAMTLLDFGAIQNRDTLFGIMDTFSRCTVSANSPAVARDVWEVESSGRKLRDLTSRLRTVRPINGEEFYNCSFISLGQLLNMLDDVRSNESFLTAVQLDGRDARAWPL